MVKNFLYKPFFIKLLHWEYWSFNVVYFPMYFYWLWLSIKARSFFFFSTSNPGITNAGFLMESKKEIYDSMPQNFYAKTILIQSEQSFYSIQQKLQNHKMNFPLVAKPDIGGRGNGVKKLFNEEEVTEYSQSSKVNFLLQEWVDYENEIGLFYYKYPNQKNGNISGIVAKEFLTITGDGVSSIEELLLQNKRYILQYKTLQQTQPEQLKVILQKDERKVLVPYGNHCRGSKFIDASNMINNELEKSFNSICNQIPDFYFGRMDIKFESWELLEQGKNFSIIELNGAGSEPTHIYDPRHSIFFAWKEIIRHYNILYKISKQNKHLLNKNYMSFSDGIKMFKEKNIYDKLVA